MSKRMMAVWGLLGAAWMLLMGGCGSDDDDAGVGGSSNQGGGGTQSSSPCGDCSGCCDGTTCLPLASQDTLSCGRNGAKCTTCGNYSKCFKGICQPDDSVCSPLTCKGCCDSNTCITASSWTSCSTGGTACKTCEPMAPCIDQTTCENDQWADDALIDLYIEQYSVSASQCDDVGSPPDPTITFTILGKTYKGTCDDQYTCTFKPAWKIPNVPLEQFQLGQVKFSIEDVDTSFNDPCWSGIMPIPKRDFTPKITKPGDGTITYHVRPAGY